MKTTNLPSGSQRIAETGLVWVEAFPPGTIATNTFDVLSQGTLRVSAATTGTGGTVIIKLDGVTAITLRPGEVERINVGEGIKDNKRKSVSVEISVSGDGEYSCQVAKAVEKGRYPY